MDCDRYHWSVRRLTTTDTMQLTELNMAVKESHAQGEGYIPGECSSL